MEQVIARVWVAAILQRHCCHIRLMHNLSLLSRSATGWRCILPIKRQYKTPRKWNTSADRSHRHRLVFKY